MMIKKIIEKIKFYGNYVWAGIVALFGIVFVAFAVHEESKIRDANNRTLEQTKEHDKTIETINNAQIEEIKRNNELLAQHTERVQEIQKEQDNKTHEIIEQQKTEQAQITAELGEDPNKMAERLNQLFGIKNDKQ